MRDTTNIPRAPTTVHRPAPAGHVAWHDQLLCIVIPFPSIGATVVKKALTQASS